MWVGIDGGGTRARAVALDAAGEVRARVEGGAALIDPTSPLDGANDLAALTRAALDAAGVGGRARALCCALAGAGRRDVRTALSLEISRLGVADDVFVIGDAEAAMYDAFRGGAGVLLIAGTGSVAWAQTPEGKSVRAGGWGTLLGDEGSGYAIGHAGLQAVVRAADGRELPTSLTDSILGKTHSRSVEDLIPWTAAAEKAEIAALAPLVLVEAESGDLCAGAIVEEAARELVEQVQAVISRSSAWSEGIPIALAGGLISPGGPLREAALRALRLVDGFSFEVSEEAVDAARGAALLAREKGGV